MWELEASCQARGCVVGFFSVDWSQTITKTGLKLSLQHPLKAPCCCRV